MINPETLEKLATLPEGALRQALRFANLLKDGANPEETHASTLEEETEYLYGDLNAALTLWESVRAFPAQLNGEEEKRRYETFCQLLSDALDRACYQLDVIRELFCWK